MHVLEHSPLTKEHGLAEQDILDVLKEFDSFGAGRWSSRSAAIATYKRIPSRLARDLEDWQSNREKIRLKIETTWDKCQYGIVHQSPDWKDKGYFSGLVAQELEQRRFRDAAYQVGECSPKPLKT